MATYLRDKCVEIRAWFAIGEDVYPDAIVTSWIRMAEEYLSNEMRVKHMIQIDTATAENERVPLPLDWQEIRLVRTLADNGVYRYQTPDAFYNPEFEDPPKSPYPGKKRRYTILGNYLILGETADGLDVELTYYQNIPPLTDTDNNWINQYHSIPYTLKILHIASLYAIEDERGPIWSKEVNDAVNSLNAHHQIDKASGSTLVPVRKKTFG